jgi:hypothetical protein
VRGPGKFIAAMLASFALLALMGPSGGFPARPRFQAIGVGTAAPATAGAATITNVATFTKTQTAGPSTSGVYLNAQNPAIGFNVQAGSADHQIYDLIGVADTLVFRNCNAALTCNALLTLSHGGSGSGSIAINGKRIAGNIVCDLGGACSATGLEVGGSVWAFNASATSRSSTTTATADPNLQITNLPSGFYEVRIYLEFAAGAGGVRYTVTAPSNGFRAEGTLNCSGVGIGAAELVSLTTVTCATTSGAFANYQGVISGTGGTFSIDWAQASSNAATTTLQSRSYIVATRL